MYSDYVRHFFYIIQRVLAYIANNLLFSGYDVIVLIYWAYYEQIVVPQKRAKQ